MAKRIDQPICLITDGGKLRSEGRLVETIESALRKTCIEHSGRSAIGMVQLREQVPGLDVPPATEEELFSLSVDLVAVCERYGSKLILNRNATAAKLAGAHGVHIGEGSGSIAGYREVLEPPALLGYSAHRVDEALAVLRAGADYVFFSPVFQPLSKPGSHQRQGTEVLMQLCGATPGAVFALGGITPDNARACRIAGASGVAVIGSILGHTEAAEAAIDLLDAWESGK